MFGIRHLSRLQQYLTKSNSKVTASLQTLSNRSVISHVKDTQITCISCRFLTCSPEKFSGKSTSASKQTPNIGEYDTLTEYHAYDMIHKLSDNDRASLLKALSKYNSDKVKSKFQGNKSGIISKNTVCFFIIIVDVNAFYTSFHESVHCD